MAAVAASLAIFFARPADAQQFVVDDAEIVDRNACQFEAWHGQTGSWILPACQFIPNLEITAGIGFVDEGGDTRDVEYVVQAKYLFRELRPNDIAFGLVAGFGFDPLAQVTGQRLHGFFAYVPATVSLFDDRAFVHGNLGFALEDGDYLYGPGHDVGHGHEYRRLTWGLRTDVWITPRAALIAEIFGEDRLYPEFQVGTRYVAIPERLEVDLSWAGNTEPGFSGAGWSFGISWTPPPFR